LLLKEIYKKILLEMIDNCKRSNRACQDFRCFAVNRYLCAAMDRIHISILSI
jgi:hypothetical protein